MTEIYTIISVIIISLISLIGVIALSINQKLLNKILFILIAVAVGAFFGDAIIHLIPESFSKLNEVEGPFYVLLGIVAFFSLEKFLRWQHTHDTHIEDDEDYIHPIGPLVIFSDGIHNAIDGAIIAASFMVSIEVGIVTTIAIALHEIPQEISDFALLLHAGYSKRKAILFNFLSSSVAIFGALITLFILNSTENILPAMTAFAAGSFLYIAGSDLVPELHKKKKMSESFIQLISILVGIGIMFALLLLD